MLLRLLIDLEWLSLEALRVVSCLTFIFKIVLGLVMLKAIQVIRSGRATRQSTGPSTLQERTVPEWNHLPGLIFGMLHLFILEINLVFTWQE